MGDLTAVTSTTDTRSVLAQFGLPNNLNLLQCLQDHYDSDPFLFVLEAAGRRFLMPRKVTCWHSVYLNVELRRSDVGTDEAPIVRLEWPPHIPISILEWFVKIIYRLHPKRYQALDTDEIFGRSDTQIERVAELYDLNYIGVWFKCDLILHSGSHALGKILHQLQVPQDTNAQLQWAVAQFSVAYDLWSSDAVARADILDAFFRLVDVDRAIDPGQSAIDDTFREVVVAHWEELNKKLGAESGNSETAQGSETGGPAAPDKTYWSVMS
ncbi:hypothetical protein PG985_002806 [Apiospora marii]|uniref:uncharacterized protein n=1 Tax=Apiospora marii TaxID=335849 RepID=UPI00312DE313